MDAHETRAANDFNVVYTGSEVDELTSKHADRLRSLQLRVKWMETLIGIRAHADVLCAVRIIQSRAREAREYRALVRLVQLRMDRRQGSHASIDSIDSVLDGGDDTHASILHAADQHATIIQKYWRRYRQQLRNLLGKRSLTPTSRMRDLLQARADLCAMSQMILRQNSVIVALSSSQKERKRKKNKEGKR